jgi:hypothetical protein
MFTRPQSVLVQAAQLGRGPGYAADKAPEPLCPTGRLLDRLRLGQPRLPVCPSAGYPFTGSVHPTFPRWLGRFGKAFAPFPRKTQHF